MSVETEHTDTSEEAMESQFDSPPPKITKSVTFFSEYKSREADVVALTDQFNSRLALYEKRRG
jgi:hypothetical protein